MMGAESKEAPELAGLIPRATEQIFTMIRPGRLSALRTLHGTSVVCVAVLLCFVVFFAKSG